MNLPSNFPGWQNQNNHDNDRRNNSQNLDIFDGYKVKMVIYSFLYIIMLIVIAFLAIIGINVLSEIGSNASLNVFHWFQAAGFNSQYELANFFRLGLLAVFIGWAINRFRRR